jgi:multicomponent Na+:H+ antiporter subunit B
VIGPHSSDNMRVVGTFVVPFVFVFGFYVTAHGHYGPGGGFAGGVILAVGTIVVRMIAPTSLSERLLPPGAALWLMVAGMTMFLATGVASLAFGGDFLDYSALPLGVSDAKSRYLSILFVEFGVGAAVFGAMLYIVDLMGRSGGET